MESRNPVLGRSAAFGRDGHASGVPSDDELQRMYDAPSYAPPARMTIDDVVMRTAAMLGVLVAVAAVAWWLGLGLGWLVGGVVVGLGLALFIIFKHSTNPALVLAYAAAEGLALGVISHYFQVLYSGPNGGLVSSIVVQAILGTVLAFGGMLAVYSTGVIRVTRTFVKGVVGALIALFGLMLINLVATFFVDGGIGIRAGGPLAILFSVAAIIVGCLLLVLDFAAIENGIEAGVPQREAWFAAFGLTVTLVWIYLEILRLLSYLRE